MKPLVSNAADTTQLKRADRKLKTERQQELEDIREMFRSPAARRTVWRWLAEFKLHGSTWHPSALIHFNEGRRDAALFILAEMGAADENLLIQMMQEKQAAERREQEQRRAEERQRRKAEAEIMEDSDNA